MAVSGIGSSRPQATAGLSSRHFRRHHRGTGTTSAKNARHRPHEASCCLSETAFRDAESPRDIDLTTCVLINQLGCI